MLLRGEIAATVDDPAEVDDEIRASSSPSRRELLIFGRRGNILSCFPNFLYNGGSRRQDPGERLTRPVT